MSTTTDTTATRPNLSDQAIEQVISDIAARPGAGKSIDPSEPARALANAIHGNDADWQRLLPLVRRTAIRMANEGRLVIYRKGKPVDPSQFRGVYRLGLPRSE